MSSRPKTALWTKRIRLNALTDNMKDKPVPLRNHFSDAVRRYLHDLNGCESGELYEVALKELEIPLFQVVLQHCEGNQSRAAAMLGINRATLRHKMRRYEIG